MQKYGFDDARPVLERASARETAARVALGTVAQAFLEQALGVRVVSHVVAIGPVAGARRRRCPGRTTTRGSTRTRCAAPTRPPSAAMVAEIDDARKNGDTLGGVVEVVVHGLPPGLGSHVHWDRRLDSRLAAALMGVQSVKARRGRRRAGDRPPPRLGGPRRDRDRRTAASPGSPTAPAASRAA